MKLSIRTKLLLSYVAIISATLILLSWFVDVQVGKHLQAFYEDLRNLGFNSLPGLIELRGYQVFLGAVRSSIFLTAIGAGLLAIFVSYLVTSYVTDPVHRLIRATKEIAQGNYEARVPIDSEDEIGDLTESLNAMAKSLEDHRYLQRQLITNVSHELATPLTNIGGYLEALTDGVIPEEKQKETLLLIKDEAERLKGMLDEVRTLTLLQEPHFKVNLALQDVEELTQKVVKQMSPQFEERKIPLQVHSHLKREKFMLDKDRYTQILLNLLNNALQYSSEGKPVKVELSEDPKTLLVKVKDEGVGIAEKDRAYVFERFYRTDQSRTRKTGGIGVGLAIVKELIEAHRGKILVESELGKGSTFTCQFPVK
jgi:two-component system, OmpR family, sensor histidine kinase BaeS